MLLIAPISDSRAYSEGVSAALESEGRLVSCPYPANSRASEVWHDGWSDGVDAAANANSWEWKED